MVQNPLRHLPSVNELLEHPQVKQLVERVNHNVVVTGARDILDEVRSQIRQAGEQVTVPTPQEIANRIAEWIHQAEKPRLRPVINGTGVLLHTGLGRAPLAEEALTAIHSVAAGYSSLEVDLDSGDRSQRGLSVEPLLCELTGAEAAVVVNNNAGATMLTLSALARGQEVIVSRGQLIEIGGSYRLPAVMEMSGAKLKEVGTTNKTHLSDYEEAINEETGALMKVHPSNYVVVGFSDSVETAPLAQLAHANDLPLIDDIGSGALFDFSQYGLADEPVIGASLEAGADVVLFSGDKLLGGPQCGIVVGKKKYIEKILRHPMMRALRVDKMTLAALAATLKLCRDRETAERSIPLLAMLSTSLENLRHRGERIAPQIESLPAIQSAELIATEAMLGGGSLPTQQIPSLGIAIKPERLSVARLAQLLRNATPAIFGRIAHDQLILDLRSIPPRHDVELVTSLTSVVGSPAAATSEDLEVNT